MKEVQVYAAQRKLRVRFQFSVVVYMASHCIHRALPPRSSQFRYLRSLLLLTLPLKAEGLVDPEFPAEGEDGHENGNAGRYIRPLNFTPHISRKEDSPEDNDCEAC